MTYFVVESLEKANLTHSQMQILFSSFHKSLYLSPSEMDRLSVETGLRPWTVRLWFRNRRSRITKQTLKQCALELSKSHQQALVEGYQTNLKFPEKNEENIANMSGELGIKPEIIRTFLTQFSYNMRNYAHTYGLTESAISGMLREQECILQSSIDVFANVIC